MEVGPTLGPRRTCTYRNNMYDKGVGPFEGAQVEWEEVEEVFRSQMGV